MIRPFAHAVIMRLCVATSYKMYTENNNMGGGGRTIREKIKLMVLPSGLAALIDYTKTVTIYYQLLDNLKPLHPTSACKFSVLFTQYKFCIVMERSICLTIKSFSSV